MHRPDPHEVAAVAVPVALAQVVVVIVLFAGSVILGHRTIWATIFGYWQ